jgi:integrase
MPGIWRSTAFVGGEVAGLRWEDVDFGNTRLNVRGARVAVDGAPLDSTPKTASGLRVLPLTPDLVAVLRRAEKRQTEAARLAGRAYRRSGFVVVDQLGSALHPETLSSRWEVLLRTAGLRRIRLHDPRHTCGTLLHLQGVPVAVIAAWLGHADPPSRCGPTCTPRTTH